jgi:hypothetical protein
VSLLDYDKPSETQFTFWTFIVQRCIECIGFGGRSSGGFTKCFIAYMTSLLESQLDHDIFVSLGLSPLLQLYKVGALKPDITLLIFS